MKKTKSITLFSNKKSPTEAVYDIIEQSDEKLDFKPDLALFYATLKYHGKYQSMLDILNDEYGDIPQIGASVDGMIYPDDMRADGAALVLCEDADARIRVDGIKGKGIIESAKKLAEKVKCEHGAIVLHFPMIHIPNAIKFAKFFASGFYYSKKSGKANLETQKEYAGKFSEYCDRENIFYQSSPILNLFAKQTNYKVPIIGMNVMHTQVRFNSPNIFSNFEDIGGGIAALTLEKKDINAVYDDIFPQKGNTLQETTHIVSNKFKTIKELKAKFEKNILISLDGKPPVEAVKNLIYISEKKEKELNEHLDKGDFKVQMPYELLFFNKKTN
ncbi:MAG TPA: FIST N-terminal domain-containing protein, partial [Candidatus Methanoperedens sp.]